MPKHDGFVPVKNPTGICDNLLPLKIRSHSVGDCRMCRMPLCSVSHTSPEPTCPVVYSQLPFVTVSQTPFLALFLSILHLRSLCLFSDSCSCSCSLTGIKRKIRKKESSDLEILIMMSRYDYDESYLIHSYYKFVQTCWSARSVGVFNRIEWNACPRPQSQNNSEATKHLVCSTMRMKRWAAYSSSISQPPRFCDVDSSCEKMCDLTATTAPFPSDINVWISFDFCEPSLAVNGLFKWQNCDKQADILVVGRRQSSSLVSWCAGQYRKDIRYFLLQVWDAWSECTQVGHAVISQK